MRTLTNEEKLYLIHLIKKSKYNDVILTSIVEGITEIYCTDDPEYRSIRIGGLKYNDSEKRLYAVVHTVSDISSKNRIETIPLSRVKSRKSMNETLKDQWPSAQTIADWGRRLLAAAGEECLMKLRYHSGDEIPDIYINEKCYGISSCMTGRKGDPFVYFYDNEHTAMVTMWDENACVARCLCWLYPKKNIVGIDRIYYRKERHKSVISELLPNFLKDETGYEAIFLEEKDETTSLPILSIPLGPDRTVPYFDNMEMALHECKDDTVCLHPKGKTLNQSCICGYVKEACCEGGPWYEGNHRCYVECWDCGDAIHDEEDAIDINEEYSVCRYCVEQNYIDVETHYGFKLYHMNDSALVKGTDGEIYDIFCLPSHMIVALNENDEKIPAPGDECVEYNGIFYHNSHPSIIEVDGEPVHEDNLSTKEI